MINADDIDLTHTKSSQPKSKRGSVQEKIKQRFLDGRIVINPNFLNTAKSHVIIYFETEQEILYSGLIANKVHTVFALSKIFFLIFENSIPEKYLNPMQTSVIKTAFADCNRDSSIKLTHQKEFEKLKQTIKQAALYFFQRKFIYQKKLFRNPVEFTTAIENLLEIYGNPDQLDTFYHLREEAIKRLNKNYSSTPKILQYLQISNLDNPGNITINAFPANFVCSSHSIEVKSNSDTKKRKKTTASATMLFKFKFYETEKKNKQPKKIAKSTHSTTLSSSL